jgi:hypothetical protein
MARARSSVAVLALLLVATLVLPPAAPQDSTSNSVSADDAEGDLQYDDESLRGSYGDGEDAVDILRVDVGPDSPTTIPIKVTFLASQEYHAGDPTSEQQLTARRSEVFLSHANIEYVVQENFGCGGFALFQQNDDETLRRVGCIETEFDDVNNEIVHHIPKMSITSATGLPVSFGQQISNIQVYAEKTQPVPNCTPGDDGISVGCDYTGGPAVFDWAPNVDGLEFTLASGGKSSENPQFTAHTNETLRATNGVAGTFLFPINLENPGDEPVQLTVSASNVWDGTEVLAQRTISLASGEQLVENVYLRILFGHVHGETKWLTIRFASNDGEWQEINLGMHWLTIPQPAGHHPNLYFHSISQTTEEQAASNGILFGYAWMNTLDIDDLAGADDVPVASRGNSFGTSSGGEPAYSNRWAVPLSPGLQLGLNFTTFGNHSFAGTVEQMAPGANVEVTAGLAICQRTDSAEATSGGNSAGSSDYGCRSSKIWEVARGESSHVVDSAGRLAFELNLAAIPGQELVQYHGENNLVLRLKTYQIAVPAGAGNEGPRLVPSETELLLAIGEYNEGEESIDGAQALGGKASPEELPETGEIPEPDIQDTPATSTFAAIAVLGLAAASLRKRT